MNPNRPFCGVIAVLAISLTVRSASCQQALSPPEPMSGLQIKSNPLEIPLSVDALDDVSTLESNAETDGPLDLSHFEQSALAGHPAVGAIAAQVNEARWRYQRAGVIPDTRVGYIGEEMGAAGTAGFQGAYLSQQIVTGRKLQLDQAVVSNEVAALQQQLAAVQQRVVTDVRKAFFSVLVAQERVELQSRLVRVAKETEQTLTTLFESGEGRLTDQLQARTEFDTQSMTLVASRQALTAAWRELIAVANIPGLALTRVDGELYEVVPDLDWDSIREALVASSPEIAQAIANVQRAQCAIARAAAERHPNLTAQVGFVTDNTSGEELVSVQASMPIPRRRRVRAEVGAARARLMRAHQLVEAIERRLTVQLAREFKNYEQSRDRIGRYREQILPRVRESRQLIARAYKLGEMSYVDLLVSQRNDFRAQAAYLDEIAIYWASFQRLDGMLLDGALQDQNL